MLKTISMMHSAMIEYLVGLTLIVVDLCSALLNLILDLVGAVHSPNSRD
jgi:hypothetical protein